MRDTRHYTRSLVICQSGVTITYITIGIVVYYYCGSYVASPALGSAGATMKKVCYGLALPGLLATTMLVIHVSIARFCISVHYLHSNKDCRQICLCTRSSWLSSSVAEHLHPLGSLARMYRRTRLDRLHHRKRHPRLWRPCLAHWCAPWNPHGFPAYGLHVAIRQLGKAKPRYQVEAHGRVERLGHCLWYIPYGCWNIRISGWHYRQLQGFRWIRGLVVCGQLQLCWSCLDIMI